MTQGNSTTGITPCAIVCWLLAFAFGIFVAAACVGWLGVLGVVAAFVGLFVCLIAGWLLKGIFCIADIPASGAATPAAVASTGAVKVEPAAKAAPKKPATKKTAAKAKAAPATKTKTAATKKPAAKKTAAKSTATSKTKTAAAKKPATKKPAAAKKPAAKKAPTKFYKSAPAKVDDLKLISGVGPKLEQTLNEIGIYQYDQVAVWKKADIKKVDDQLKFKGRIERDDWMKQAKILAKGGDTEFSKKKRK